MLKKYSLSFFMILLVATPQHAFAQEFQEPNHDALVKEAIANLDSNDIKVAAQAAIHLGMYKATEAVPKLLQVLQSSRLLRKTEHVMAKDEKGLSYWVNTNVRAEIVTSLGLIGDQRAVPVLKKYLKRPLSNNEVFTGNVAQALYLITGKTYVYKDYDGVQKLYQPSALAEEEFRKRARPDLKASSGLIASLEIEGHDPGGAYWKRSRPLNINLVITNQSKRVIAIDAAKENFEFSSVAGNGRRVTSATLLPSPQPPVKNIEVLAPGQKLRLSWIVDLKDSPLSREWSGYVNIKCVYTNPLKQKQESMWRGQKLISNSVERYYYGADE